ncbi:TIGR03862 family flavoprotein [Kordiimonas gwangyangensis]|uniref:TIGR03862 family flavoprotein n=1 Tax=Kordiimonas gwangyangensis TaxID=288022 RepID=UPI00192E325B|nr:TIGR03862 family flavoprotein [Kordiimonas gwangyangensis]
MTQPILEVDIAIMGGGPAGLMAAEVLTRAGHAVHIFEAMPTPARKFLMAGKSGLNITHSEPLEQFLTRYGAATDRVSAAVRHFTPDDIRAWADGLGTPTFVGSSGRVFPEVFKGSPLLRAWLAQLGEGDATLHTRHRWVGWQDDAHLFETPGGPRTVKARTTLFAFGGTSWPRLGGNGNWTSAFEAAGIPLAPFRPANCGFNHGWSEFLSGRFAGEPVKNVLLGHKGQTVQGDFIVTHHGIEGSSVYALSASLRDTIEAEGKAVLTIDLTPDRTVKQLSDALARPRGKKSFATHLKRATGLTGIKAALLRELLPPATFDVPEKVAAGIKTLPLELTTTRPVAEAISVAGGVCFDAVDEHLMLKAVPGQFVAGEMLDWEAPTGGYLLTACMAEGRQAANGMLHWLKRD